MTIFRNKQYNKKRRLNVPPTRWTLTALYSWNESSYNGTHYTWPRIPTSSAQPVFFDSLYLNLYIYYTMNRVLNKSLYVLFRIIPLRTKDYSEMMRNLFRPLETVLNTENCTIKKNEMFRDVEMIGRR